MSEQNRTMSLQLTCAICKEQQPEILVNPEDFKSWKKGKLIQDAFPYLTSSEREMLISQTCSPCWDKMWLGDGNYLDESAQ